MDVTRTVRESFVVHRFVCRGRRHLADRLFEQPNTFARGHSVDCCFAQFLVDAHQVELDADSFDAFDVEQGVGDEGVKFLFVVDGPADSFGERRLVLAEGRCEVEA